MYTLHTGHVVTPLTGIDDLLDLPGGGVVVDRSDGTVEAVGKASDLRKAYPDATVADHGDRLIVPGFVDCHVHYPQLGMIASPGEELLDWLDRYTFPAEARFADDDWAHSRARLFTDQLTAHGVTTACVYPTVHKGSVDALFHAAHDRNLRIITGKVCMDCNAPDNLLDTPDSAVRDSLELLERWHGVGRLEYAVTPRFAPTSSDAQLRALGELAAAHPDTVIQTHLAENRGECRWVAELFPDAADYTDVYDSAGLVRRRAVFGHAVHLSDRETGRLAEAHASLAHCPTSNNFLGSGLFPLHDIAFAGGDDLRIGLGSDVGAGTSLSPLTTAGEAYKVSRLLGSPLSVAELLRLSTLGGAEALGVEDSVGSLEVGKDADLVILDPASSPVLEQRAEQCTTTAELLFALMILGDDRAVSAVTVAGETVDGAA